MASTERSLGWATSGTGDGPAGGYDSSRWRANAQKSDGTGITLYGSQMAMSGTTTSTLTIADGAAIINGYTYETNGAVTISTTGLTGTYSVVLVANNSGGTVTVTANGAGTTTIAASTIRAAIATSAQVTTIITAVGAANVITLGSTTIAAGVISTITPVYPYSTSLQLPAQSYGLFSNFSSALSISNVTYTGLTGWASTASSADGSIVGNVATGELTTNIGGVFLAQLVVQWDTNTTGSRVVYFTGSGFSSYTNYDQYSQPASNLTASNYVMTYQKIIILVNTGGAVSAAVYQNSGSARTMQAYATLQLVRL